MPRRKEIKNCLTGHLFSVEKYNKDDPSSEEEIWIAIK
jgi:hypothetical protein